MKKYLIALSAAAFALSACTDIESIDYGKVQEVDYAALRAYKQTDHELMFGWFGDWNGGGISMSTSLRSLPDSMDMVSIWGGQWVDLTDEMKEDMKYAQEVKGIKVLATIFTPVIGRYITPEGEDNKAYWGWDDKDEDSKVEAVKKYARALAQTVIDLGFNGMDMDNETEGGSDGALFQNTKLTSAFIETIGEYLGPQSGTDYIFAIDGHLTYYGLARDIDKYVNYFIQQSYGTSSDEGIDREFSALVDYYNVNGATVEEMARKYIITTNFESYANTGGGGFSSTYLPSQPNRAEGFAWWQPQDGKGNFIPKGGSGMYHIETDYLNSTYDYYHVRRAIAIQNNKDRNKSEDDEQR